MDNYPKRNIFHLHEITFTRNIHQDKQKNRQIQMTSTAKLFNLSSLKVTDQNQNQADMNAFCSITDLF